MRFKEFILLTFLLSFLNFQFVTAQEKPEFKLGGALRFNYNYSDWKKDSRKKGGDFGYDVFKLDLHGAYKNFILYADYRFYAKGSGGPMLRSGWFGYKISDKHQLQVGLTQVPFGIQPATGNNFFFSINYYLGLEDDSDMGVKYLYTTKCWDLAFAFFKNGDVLDFGNKSTVSPDRYGYDIAGRNKETNQGNVQVVYKWGDKVKHQLGISGLLGGIYNIDTEKMGLRAAFATHYTLSIDQFDLKLQYSCFSMSPKNAPDEYGIVNKDVVSMAAYGAEYDVATKADTYLANISYTIPFKRAIIDYIRIYNDFSMMHKKIKGFKDSYQNVSGVMIAAGPIYTYIDYALGKNQSWFSNAWTESFAQGDSENGWNARFNINIGYYF